MFNYSHEIRYRIRHETLDKMMKLALKFPCKWGACKAIAIFWTWCTYYVWGHCSWRAPHQCWMVPKVSCSQVRPGRGVSACASPAAQWAAVVSPAAHWSLFGSGEPPGPGSIFSLHTTMGIGGICSYEQTKVFLVVLAAGK